MHLDYMIGHVVGPIDQVLDDPITVFPALRGPVNAAATDAILLTLM